MGFFPSFLFPGLSLLFSTAGSAPFIISLEILPSYFWRPVVRPLLVRGVALLLSQRFSGTSVLLEAPGTVSEPSSF